MTEQQRKEIKKIDRQVLAIAISALVLPFVLVACGPKGDNAGLNVQIPDKEPFQTVTWKASLYTDPENGCQYLQPHSAAPFTPRLDIDGRQICGGQHEVK